MKKIPAKCLLRHIFSMTNIRQTLEEWSSGVMEYWGDGIK